MTKPTPIEIMKTKEYLAGYSDAGRAMGSIYFDMKDMALNAVDNNDPKTALRMMDLYDGQLSFVNGCIMKLKKWIEV